MPSDRDVVAVLLERHGRTYADEAGIRLADRPAPLFQLLVLALLLSARISASVAVAASRELFAAGYRTASAMADASWQDRVDALGRGHYRRYDERTSTMLGDTADLVLDRYGGDLRRLRAAANSVRDIERRLDEFPGIGPTGAAIFCREVQGVWPDVAVYVGSRAADGAAALGLPRSPQRLAALVPPDDLPRLAAACVRASLNRGVVDDVRAALT